MKLIKMQKITCVFKNMYYHTLNKHSYKTFLVKFKKLSK